MNRERIRRPGAMAAIAAFALVVLAACGSNPAEEAEHEEVTRIPTMSDAAAQATREGANATPGAATAVPNAATSVTITSNDIFFDPKEVTIPANTDVKFILPNHGASAHDFSIDALNVQVSIPAGETKEIVVNAPAGEYEYYCNVPGHKQAGMVGKLIVSAEAAPAAGGAATPAAAASPATASSAAATPVSEAATQEAATAAPAGTAAAAAPAAAAEAPVVTSHDIYFDPKEFSIPANTDVTVKLPNEGVTMHDFSIDALGIQVSIQPGETQEVVINAPAGEYEYYCNVPGHKQAGMVGKLIVTEGAAAPAEVASSGASAASPAAAEAAPQEAATAAAEAPASAEAVEVVSHDIFFDPKEISIPANTDVTVKLPNEGVTMHDFSIDALNIHVDIQPGETQEVVINAPAGTYEYYCNVPGHKQAGMVGTLTVG